MHFRKLFSCILAVSAGTFLSFTPVIAQTGGPTVLMPNQQRSLLTRFTDKIDEAMEQDKFVGLAIAVVENGQITMIRSWGEREQGSGMPVTEDTMFRIASVSKGFSSTLAGLLVEEGTLSWSTPVKPYVPAFRLKSSSQTDAVTIDHILSHRVGLPPYAYDNLLEARRAPETILSEFRKVDMICRIGTCYAYQNITYNMIKTIIERIDGLPFAASLEARLFDPLGIDVTIGEDGLTTSGNWARPHIQNRNDRWEVSSRPDSGYYEIPAAGGLNASISDMAGWLLAQMGYRPDVLSPALLAQLHQPAVETQSETSRQNDLRVRLNTSWYGYGWRIYDYAGHRVVNHSGGVRGYGAQIAFLPDRNIGIVVLSNTREKAVWRILPTFLDLQLGLAEKDWLELTENEAD